MTLNEAIDIHFKNILFENSGKYHVIMVLKNKINDLRSKNAFDLDEKWYIHAMSSYEFLQFIAIDAMNNITRRFTDEPLTRFTEKEIEKIQYTLEYEDIARIALGLLTI